MYKEYLEIMSDTEVIMKMAWISTGILIIALNALIIIVMIIILKEGKETKLKKITYDEAPRIIAIGIAITLIVGYFSFGLSAIYLLCRICEFIYIKIACIT